MRLLAVGLITTLALALLPGASGLAVASDLDVRIRPATEGNTAVRNTQDVLVSGSAPVGARIHSARLVGIERTGGSVSQSVPTSQLNRGPGEGPNYLNNSNGTLEGRLTLGCRFGPPTDFCPHNEVRQVYLEVFIGGEIGLSETLRVDYVRPHIRRYDLVAPNRIRVVFSEPVRNNAGDSRDDWEITQPSRTVLRVDGPVSGDCLGEYLTGEDATAGSTGCTRTLVLLTELDEDATPFVEPRVQGILQRGQYTDFASNAAFLSTHGARSHAKDRIRPPLPRIDTVAGQQPDDHKRVTGATRTPDITVSNLRAGHTVHFEVNGNRVLSEPAEGTSHSTTLPHIGPGAEFDIHAIVEDPGGNLSTQGSKQTARRDSSPSRVCYGFEQPCDPPTLAAPGLHTPEEELYTNEASVTVAGVLDPVQDGLEVELVDRLTGQMVGATTSDEDGEWAINVSWNDLEQRRFQYDVVTRDGGLSQTERVPDIVFDRNAPLAQVLQPSVDLTQIISRLTLDARSRFSAGSVVNVAWLATDPALLDLTNPDHGSHVDIDLLYADDSRRTVVEDLPYTPLVQTYGHVLTAADVGNTEREARFEVTVTDLAGNATTSMSMPFVLDASILDYTPVFVRNQANNSMIEARFPVPLEGSTTPLDWRIDGQPVRSATAVQRGGATVVELVATQSITDPNATPTVRFTPTVAAANRLRGADGRDISTGERVAVDGIPPALDIQLPDPGPRSASSVAITGRTDQTSRPNTVVAVRNGRQVAHAVAGEDGRFTLDVPLAPDRLNRVEVSAIDPASNRSPGRLFEVIEDSTAPVVVIDNPLADTSVPRSLPIRWRTIDNNPDVVDIEYRVGGGDWQSIVSGAPDDGSYRWQVPVSLPETSVLSLRITATDKAGHRGNAATVRGLSLLPSLLAACEDVQPAPFADRELAPEVHRWAIDCLYELGIARGSQRGGQLQFDPQRDISRGQFTRFLHRTLEHARAALPGPAARFDDVPAGHTFDLDIHQLAAAEVVLGYTPREFGPRDAIKRDQTASLLLRALGYVREEEIRPEAGGYFADTTTSAHHRNIDAAFEQGLVVGRSEPTSASPGTYDPAALTTRAQMATVLVRALAQLDG